MRKNQDGNSLYNFELYYEETEEKKLTKAKPTVKSKSKVRVNKKSSERKTSFKNRFESIKKNAYSNFNNTLTRLKKQPKTVKKVTKAQKKEIHEQRKRGILGIGLLLVIVSIIYSTTIVREFVGSAASLVALAPQVIFAGIILVKAFSKLYK